MAMNGYKNDDKELKRFGVLRKHIQTEMKENSFFRTEPEFVHCCLRERAKRVRTRALHVFLTESKDALYFYIRDLYNHRSAITR